MRVLRRKCRGAEAAPGGKFLVSFRISSHPPAATAEPHLVLRFYSKIFLRQRLTAFNEKRTVIRSGISRF